MADLQNARIDQLPNSSGAKAGDFLAIRNMQNGVTERLDVAQLLTSPTTGNFEYLTTNDYEEDEVVTRDGTWWQAVQDNGPGSIVVVPGTDVSYWIQIPKSPSGFVFWQTGAYVEDQVFVLRSLDQFIQIFRLANIARPFVSSDFETEYAQGDWELMSERGYVGIQKATHGFVVNDVLTYKSGAWNKFADGDIPLAIVRVVESANLIIVVLLGNRLKGLTGLTPGSTYYAQNDATISTVASDNAIFLAVSATEAIILAAGGGGASPFLGLFLSSAALTTAFPTAEPGNYAFVDTGIGSPVHIWLWDDNDATWVDAGATTITGWSTTTPGTVERSDTSESQNIVTRTAAGSSNASNSDARTPSEKGLVEMFLSFLATAWTWASKQTFTTAPRFSSTTASQILEVDASKDLISVAKGSAYNKDFATNAEAIAGVINNKPLQPANIAAFTETGRVFTETLVFDKTEILFAPKVMTADLNYALGSGNLVNTFSSALQTITSDGIHSINFGSGFDFIYGMNNGGVLPAGTYQFFFLHINDSVTVNIPGRSQESSGLQQLSIPSSFNVTAASVSQLNLSWTDVANESGYQIERSLTGTGGWTLYSTPSAGATSDTETGLTSGSTVYYRIKALGDGISYADSGYATASGTTSSVGDTTPPTFTFLPAAAATDWPINKVITITANEAIRNADGSVLTDANIAAVVFVKQTNSGGATIPYTATIDATKRIVTITPVTNWGATQVVYVAINNVEDSSGNEVASAQSITFTTGVWTEFNGTSNRLDFGDIMDTLFATNDIYFEFSVTIKNQVLSGDRIYAGKADTTGNQRSWAALSSGTDFKFFWTPLGTSTGARIIIWTNVLTAGQHTIRVTYDGSIDTNSGLDRASLYIDGVLQGSKSLASFSGTLGQIFSSTARLAIGTYLNSAGVPVGTFFYIGEMKDFLLKSGSGGSVTEINVPVIAIGTDSSGNSRNGTWF